MQKRWVVAEQITEEMRGQFPEIDPVTLQLLANRGISTASEIEDFLEPRYDESIHDPYLFDDMRIAVERICGALKNNELIIVYGDYDVDGICASTVLVDILKLLGGRVEVYLPHREKEGYGLKVAAVSALHEKGGALIITNDSGITNKVEVEHANTLGIDVIITDHHHPPHNIEDLPPALAIIHPQVHADRYPFKHLAGVGSAFKLVQGIVRADFDEWLIERRSGILNEQGAPMNWGAYEKWLLDVVSIATVTDCMPLRGENRAIVKYGLVVLNKTRRAGLKALLANAKREGADFDTQTIGFFIGPRINAASRMTHASAAFNLMTSTTAEEATNYAALLEQSNTERQELSARMTEEADVLVSESYLAGKKILMAMSRTWPIGVLGLVAGRIAGKYHRPVILATSANGHIDGTARSIPTFNVAECFESHKDFFARYGGHAAAGGFSMKEGADFNALREGVEEFAEKTILAIDLIPVLKVDMEIPLAELNWELYDTIQKIEPCGQENSRPNFLFRGVEVLECRAVGKDNKHLKLTVRQEGRVVKTIAFSLGEWAGELPVGALVDVVGELSVNQWNGNRELELMVSDIRHYQEDQA